MLYVKVNFDTGTYYGKVLSRDGDQWVIEYANGKTLTGPLSQESFTYTTEEEFDAEKQKIRERRRQEKRRAEQVEIYHEDEKRSRIQTDHYMPPSQPQPRKRAAPSTRPIAPSSSTHGNEASGSSDSVVSSVKLKLQGMENVSFHIKMIKWTEAGQCADLLEAIEEEQIRIASADDGFKGMNILHHLRVKLKPFTEYFSKKDERGLTAILVACKIGSVDCLKVFEKWTNYFELEKLGPKKDTYYKIEDEANKSPLMYVCESGSIACYDIIMSQLKLERARAPDAKEYILKKDNNNHDAFYYALKAYSETIITKIWAFIRKYCNMAPEEINTVVKNGLIEFFIPENYDYIMKVLRIASFSTNSTINLNLMVGLCQAKEDYHFAIDERVLNEINKDTYNTGIVIHHYYRLILHSISTNFEANLSNGKVSDTFLVEFIQKIRDGKFRTIAVFNQLFVMCLPGIVNSGRREYEYIALRLLETGKIDFNYKFDYVADDGSSQRVSIYQYILRKKSQIPHEILRRVFDGNLCASNSVNEENECLEDPILFDCIDPNKDIQVNANYNNGRGNYCYEDFRPPESNKDPFDGSPLDMVRVNDLVELLLNPDYNEGRVKQK